MLVLLLRYKKYRLRKKLKFLGTIGNDFAFKYRWSKYGVDCIQLVSDGGKTVPYVDGIVKDIHQITKLQIRIIDPDSSLSNEPQASTEFIISGKLNVGNLRCHVIVDNSLPMYILGNGPRPCMNLK